MKTTPLFLIIVLGFCVGSANAADPAGPTLNAKRVITLRDEKLIENNSIHAADLNAYIAQASAAGVLTPEFEVWWKKNQKSHLQASQQAKDDIDLGTYTSVLYAEYSRETAKALDANNPQAAKQIAEGKSTTGKTFLERSMAHVTEHPLMSTILGTAGGQIIWSVTKGVGSFLSDKFFMGPSIRLSNTMTEPLIRPIDERLNQWVNSKLAPKTVWWAQLASGEGRRRKKAIEAARNGGELSEENRRFVSPSMTVEDFAKDTEDFYGEMMKADYRWRGWIMPEFARGRNTGFELLYNQYRILSEQLNTYHNSKLAAELKAERLELSLEADGVAKVDLEKLAKETHAYLNEAVYQDLASVKTQALNQQIQKHIQIMLDMGVDSNKLLQYYDIQNEIFYSDSRTAFTIASFLDGERYYQENNVALRGLDRIQAWQEQAREQVGFYRELEKHSENVEKYFKKRGLKYNVMARAHERGYPLGGDMRPKDIAPHEDCALRMLRAAVKAD